MDRRVDLLLALIVIALGIFIIFVAADIRSGIDKDLIGPRAFFYGIGVLFIIGGGILATRLLLDWRNHEGNEIPSDGSGDEAPEYSSSARRAGVLFIVTLAYAVLFRPLGFLLSTPLFFAGGLVAMNQRNWKVIVSVGISFTIFFYLLFAVYLRVRLPVGPLHGIFYSLGWVTL